MVDKYVACLVIFAIIGVSASALVFSQAAIPIANAKIIDATHNVSLYQTPANTSDFSGLILSDTNTSLEQSIGWQEGDQITIQITDNRTGKSSTVALYPQSL